MNLPAAHKTLLTAVRAERRLFHDMTLALSTEQSFLDIRRTPTPGSGGESWSNGRNLLIPAVPLPKTP